MAYPVRIFFIPSDIFMRRAPLGAEVWRRVNHIGVRSGGKCPSGRVGHSRAACNAVFGSVDPIPWTGITFRAVPGNGMASSLSGRSFIALIQGERLMRSRPPLRDLCGFYRCQRGASGAQVCD